MDNCSTISRVKKLKELFPDVAQNFLEAMCAPYEGNDEVAFEEIVDLVLSFEDLPLEVHQVQIKNMRDGTKNKDVNFAEQYLDGDLSHEELGSMVFINSVKEEVLLESSADSKHPVELNRSHEQNGANEDIDVFSTTNINITTDTEQTELPDSFGNKSFLQTSSSSKHHGSMQNLEIKTIKLLQEVEDSPSKHSVDKPLIKNDEGETSICVVDNSASKDGLHQCEHVISSSECELTDQIELITTQETSETKEIKRTIQPIENNKINLSSKEDVHECEKPAPLNECVTNTQIKLINTQNTNQNKETKHTPQSTESTDESIAWIFEEKTIQNNSKEEVVLNNVPCDPFEKESNDNLSSMKHNIVLSSSLAVGNLSAEERPKTFPSCNLNNLVPTKNNSDLNKNCETVEFVTMHSEIKSNNSDNDLIGAGIQPEDPSSSRESKHQQIHVPTKTESDILQSSENKPLMLRRRLSSSSGTSDDGHPKRTVFFCSKAKDVYKLRMKLLRQSKRLGVRKSGSDNAKSPSQFDTVESKYSLLCKILPNADPAYLLSQSKKITNQEEMLMFISQSLEIKDYPKVQKNEQKRTMEKFECSVQDFLEQVPDPVADFSSDHYMRIGYEGNAEIYLQSRYQKLDETTIKELLVKYNYNLTKICQQLDSEGQEASSYCLDHLELHHSAGVFFHQEVWFIENRAEIQNQLDSALEAFRVEEELNKPPTPPSVKEVFECGICSEEIMDYSQLGTCDGPKGHLFCRNCIKRNTEIRFAEGATTFPCLTNCGGTIHLRTIEEVLPHQLFEKLVGKIQEDEIRTANIPGVETCPFCTFAYVPEDLLFVCQNPPCMKISCRACRKEDHYPDICQMLKQEDEEAARHIIENRMSEALMRECYKCGKRFIKTDGCNKMTCTCGARMCYLCRQPVFDYSHFNGQGGDNYDRCELYSDESTLHVHPVKASAQQALSDIIANNPGLKLDAVNIPK